MENDGHDNIKCENEQNNSRGDIHSWGMVVITLRMP